MLDAAEDAAGDAGRCPRRCIGYWTLDRMEDATPDTGCCRERYVGSCWTLNRTEVTAQNTQQNVGGYTQCFAGCLVSFYYITNMHLIFGSKGCILVLLYIQVYAIVSIIDFAKF